MSWMSICSASQGLKNLAGNMLTFLLLDRFLLLNSQVFTYSRMSLLIESQLNLLLMMSAVNAQGEQFRCSNKARRFQNWHTVPSPFDGL